MSQLPCLCKNEDKICFGDALTRVQNGDFFIFTGKGLQGKSPLTLCPKARATVFAALSKQEGGQRSEQKATFCGELNKL